jgi:purine-binding chemotaxis protein CheW
VDFLKIRKKAKERAGPRETPSRPGQPADAPSGAAVPPADPVVTDADVLEGELAARLQGLPPAADQRFTTWRPGSGAPPQVEVPVPPAPEPRQEDFTVVAVSGAAPAAAPAEPPAAAPAARQVPLPRDPLAEFFYRPDEEAPEVPEVGAPATAPAEEEARSLVREEYLTFLLGGESYAVAIEQVREVMKAPPITEVPHAPPHVLGVVTVRGEVVAVFDPRRRLGLPAAPPPDEGKGRVVIVDAGDGPCGLVVDVVSSVVRLRPGSIEPCPQGLGGPGVECFAGIGREGDRLFTVLDLGAFVRRPPNAARRADEEDRHAGR